MTIWLKSHQPSSEIFKLFDRLLLMDQEGHPVYYGDPVDAVVYFKKVTGQVNSDVGQCSACGKSCPVGPGSRHPRSCGAVAGAVRH